MSGKKKTANKMTDAELLRRVFPEPVAKAIEEEVQQAESELSTPDENNGK